MIRRILGLEKKKNVKPEVVKGFRVIWDEGGIHSGSMGEIPNDVITILAPQRIAGIRMRLGEFKEKYPGGTIEEIVIERKAGNA